MRVFLLLGGLLAALPLSASDKDEDFQPFVMQAKERFADGDYDGADELADTLLKHRPGDRALTELKEKIRTERRRLAVELYRVTPERSR